MSVESINMVIDVQDATNGENIDLIDFDDFSYSLNNFPINIEINYGQYRLFNNICRILKEKQHDIFIKLGYKS